jgi:hypothetical protein
LSIRREGETFKISFGCQAMPLAGDGASWRVSFKDNDVIALSQKDHWVS